MENTILHEMAYQEVIFTKLIFLKEKSSKRQRRGVTGQLEIYGTLTTTHNVSLKDSFPEQSDNLSKY